MSTFYNSFTFDFATFHALGHILEALVLVLCYALISGLLPLLKLVLVRICSVQQNTPLTTPPPQATASHDQAMIEAIPAFSGTSSTQSSLGSSTRLYPHLGFHS